MAGRQDINEQLIQLQRNEIHQLNRDQFIPTALRPTKNEAKIIAIYAEKGGVGKTTICTSLAYQFAKSTGKRVLLYDCDSQRSLTAWLLGNEMNGLHENDLDRTIDAEFIKNQHPDRFEKTLYDQFIHHDKPAYCIPIAQNLFLVPGSRKIGKLNEQISLDENLAAITPIRTNDVTARPYHCIQKTAKEFNVNYVFLDLSPNSESLNRCLIMTSHYLIIPTIPDFFSYECIKSMTSDLIEWNQRIDRLRPDTARNMGNFKLPDHKVKFLGYILNRYKVSKLNKAIDRGVIQDELLVNQKLWAQKIQTAADSLSELASDELAVQRYTRSGNLIGKIRDLFTLIATSDILHMPVPFMESRHLYRYKDEPENDDATECDQEIEKILNESKHLKKIKEIREIYENICENILKIMDENRN